MIDIKTIGKKKKSTDGTVSTSSNSGFAVSTTVQNNEVQGVNIWGQYHDHTSDVDGDMMVNGGITATANLVVDGDISCSELVASEIVNDTITTNHLQSASTVTDYLNVLNNAAIAGELKATDIDCINLDGKNVTTDYLTVTKQAHFFSLIIDEVKSAGGQIILSAANATVDSVTDNGNQYVLSWRCKDGEKAIENQFKMNDQVICQTFNRMNAEGTNVENRYYWGVVQMIGEGTATINGEETDVHYITISKSDMDGTSIPKAGDNIVQLGYRGTDDNARQSAIILSAYKSPDANVQAPAIVQYAGINSFSLDGKIVNQISPNGNSFTGSFKVVNGGTTTNIIDLINGQQPQVVTDSGQSWIMADSSSRTYALSDYQNLPTVIQVYLGNEIIPYSEWTTGSQIIFNDKTYRLVGISQIPPQVNGINITGITKNTNDVKISWTYKANTDYDTSTQQNVNQGTEVSNTNVDITVNFTHNGTSYTAQKTVPMNVIKASETTKGADAEYDKLMMDKFDFTVTLDNALTANIDAKVYHVKGNTISQIANLADYSANVLLSNGATVTLNKSTSFTKSGVINDNYTGMENPPTSATLRLYKSNVLVDEANASVKFAAGSVFEITDNAISAAVQQSNGYTDNKVAQVQLTADGISSRVTAIENDYVTSSELTQTANNIQLNVYDELKNKTGIDVSAGQITLQGNTLVNGNLTISESEQGFTLIGESGITQIMPKSIGTYNEFTSLSSTTIEKVGKTYGIELNETEELVRFKFVTDFILQNIKQGSTITISPKSRDYYTFSNVNIHHYTEISKVISFLEEGVSKKSQAWTTDTVDYTAQGNTITIRTTDTVDIPTYFFNDDHEINAPWQWIKINVTVPNESFMLVGYDGMAVNFGTSATAYFGAESATVKYGDYGLQISEQGLKKWNGSNWVGINSKKVITMTTDTTLTNDDDLIVYNSSTQRTLTLPNNLEVGKTVYIKKLGSSNLKLQSSTSNIYIQNSTSGTASTTVSTFVFLVWDGSHWLLGYVG